MTAEDMAIRMGLMHARRAVFSKVLVEGDSKLIINVVLSKCTVYWKLKILFIDITSLKGWFEDIHFAHVFREANFIADTLVAFNCLRESNGLTLAAAAAPLGHVSMMTAKDMALGMGLVHARRVGFSKVLVEGDSKLIIDIVLSKCTVYWKLKILFIDITSLKGWFEDIHFAHVFREANLIADTLVAFSCLIPLL
ncbi:hypothetical protein DVH24_008089 [Malus domestica]|uniref:RNase H type-1 domain-containing protein n=1 Tax=Malus domestica TaxID=3750 RepID=A0A498JI93_MALDO|nr:hypothetical protein DVH24_008089 [Malus domestica]